VALPVLPVVFDGEDEEGMKRYSKILEVSIKKEPCPACNDTGWYGDNGPGITGNREYMPCDQCTAYERAMRRKINRIMEKHE
jgi:hypothetical protein